MHSVAFVSPSFPALSVSQRTLSIPASPVPRPSFVPLPHTSVHVPVQIPNTLPPAPPGRPTRILLWLHTDLRVADNPALVEAASNARLPGGCLVPVCQPSARSIPFAQSLKHALQRLGSDLITPPGSLEASLIDICDRLKLHAVYFNRAVHLKDIAIQKRVTNALSRAGIRVEAFWGNTLAVTDRLLSTKSVTIFDVRKEAEAMRGGSLAEPDSLPALPGAVFGIRQAALCAKEGLGTTVAMRVLSGMRREEETLELSKRPDLAVLLQPHLRYGTLSPRMVALTVKSVMNKLAGRTFSELVWRAYECIVEHRKVGVKSVRTTVSA